MAQVERIRWYRHVKGLSQRETAEVLQISRHTVAKYENETEVVRYERTQPYEAPILGPYKAEIERLLDENARLPKKQRWIGQTVFAHLLQQGYTGSAGAVRRYIGQVRKHKRKRQAFLPLGFDPGEAAEFDWGEAWVRMAGEQVKAQLFCYRLRWSHMIVVRLYPRQVQEAMFDGFRWAFETLGGVPRRVTADNLRQAVQKVLEGRKRKEQAAFYSFRTHYLFESHFCMPAAAWEKGSVENLVGWAQRNIIGPHFEADSWEEAQRLAWERCVQYAQRTFAGEEQPVIKRWKEEQQALKPLPAVAYECCRVVPVPSTGLALVRWDTCSYSVPVRFAHQQLTLRAYWDRIEVWSGLQRIARHRRSNKRHDEVFDLDHYLELLLQKPGALDHARPFRQASLPSIYHQFRGELRLCRDHGDREFIRVLMLHREFPPEQVEAAVAAACQQRTFHLEAVRQWLLQQQGDQQLRLDPTVQRLPAVTVNQPAPRTYNQLLKGGAVH